MEAIKSASDYRIELESLQDPDWTFYEDQVRPLSSYVLERSMLMIVLQELQKNGDPLTTARDFDHHLAFTAGEARQRFAGWAAARQFTINSSSESELDSRIQFELAIARSEVPDWRFVNGTLYDLVIGASRHGGRYTGNGCVAQINSKGPSMGGESVQ